MRKPRAFRPDAFDDQLEHRRVLSHVAAHIPAHYNYLNLHGIGNARLAPMTSNRLNLGALEHPTANAVGAAASFTSFIVSSPANQSPGKLAPLGTLTSLLPPAGTTVSTSNTTSTTGSTVPVTTFLPATGTFVTTGSTIPVITSPTTSTTPSTPISPTGASTTMSANSTAANPAVTTFLNGLDTTLNNSATMIA